MFNSYKKIQFIDYQDSYYYQEKRKKQRRKWLKLLLLFIGFALLLVMVVLPLAHSQNMNNPENALAINDSEKSKHDEPENNALINSPQLIFNYPSDNHLDDYPAINSYKINRQNIALPIDINADIEIHGLIAYTKIKQVFINPYNLELSGKYQFPLPETSAVKSLTIKVGEKEIVGKIMEKQAAKAAFKKAKLQGKKASLVQQQRANLFSNNIANIPALSIVEVTLTFITPVSFANNEFNINLPLAITTRYHPKQYKQSPAEQTNLNNRTHNSSSELIDLTHLVHLSNGTINNLTRNLNSENTVKTSQAVMNIKLDSGLPITSIRSASHTIYTDQIDTLHIGKQQSQYLITLPNEHTTANRNFNLTWQLEPSQHPQISSFTEQVDDEHYTLLTFFPPQTEQPVIFSRDIIFIIDTSGSMQGASMAQAKDSLRQAISLLTNKDSFNIIAFDNSADLLFSHTQMVSNNNIIQAHKFIDNLQADGGTEMYRPLSQALIMKKNSAQTTQAIRQLVFITDGAVANEFELMQLLDGAKSNFRLFTVGIGAAPNGYFMKKAAQFGRGDYVYIQNINDVQRRISVLMTKISQPAISDIELIFDNQVHQYIDVYPKKITDLYMGEAMQVAIKSKLPISSVQLTGNSTTQPWYQQIIIDDTTQSKGISTIWARQKIEDLLDGLVTGEDKEIVKKNVILTSLSHQIISPYTSFIAIEKQGKPSDILTAKNHAKTQQSLLVALPKTALAWQQQFFFGLIFILLASVSLRLKFK